MTKKEPASAAVVGLIQPRRTDNLPVAEKSGPDWILVEVVAMDDEAFASFMRRSVKLS